LCARSAQHHLAQPSHGSSNVRAVRSACAPTADHLVAEVVGSSLWQVRDRLRNGGDRRDGSRAARRRGGAPRFLIALCREMVATRRGVVRALIAAQLAATTSLVLTGALVVFALDHALARSADRAASPSREHASRSSRTVARDPPAAAPRGSDGRIAA